MRCTTVSWTTCALLMLVSAPGTTAQGTFEGMVAYDITTGNGQSGQLKYYQQGTRIREEIQAAGSPGGVVIYDGQSGESITLVPQRKQYVVMNFRKMAEALRPMAQQMSGAHRSSADLSRMQVTPTGRRETVAGIACEHYIFSSTDSSSSKNAIDVCGASGMGFLGMAGQGGPSMPSTMALLQANNPQLAKFAHDGFFPLKMTMETKDGGATWTATQVDRHSLDASLFAPPAGYTQLTIPSIPGIPGVKP